MTLWIRRVVDVGSRHGSMHARHISNTCLSHLNACPPHLQRISNATPSCAPCRHILYVCAHMYVRSLAHLLACSLARSLARTHGRTHTWSHAHMGAHRHPRVRKVVAVTVVADEPPTVRLRSKQSLHACLNTFFCRSRRTRVCMQQCPIHFYHAAPSAPLPRLPAASPCPKRGFREACLGTHFWVLG